MINLYKLDRQHGPSSNAVDKILGMYHTGCHLVSDREAKDYGDLHSHTESGHKSSAHGAQRNKIKICKRQ